MPALAGNRRDRDREEEIRGKGKTAVQLTAHAIETPQVPRSEARARRGTLERDRRAGGLGIASASHHAWLDELEDCNRDCCLFHIRKLDESTDRKSIG